MSARLSLCIIFRDEAAMLPGFLDSLRGLLGPGDELVAVDTGSTDGGPALLASFGARVVTHPWRDDFADARNVSLAHARGDMALVLDPDERPCEALKAQVRSVLEARDVGAATLVMENRLPQGHLHRARLLRLFRLEPSIRYQHRIHEDASESVFAYLQASALRLVHLAGTVTHLGYVRTHAAARGKKERDVTLLRAALASDPLDVYSRFKLLEQLRFWEDHRALALEAAAARERVDATPGCLRRAHSGGELLALVARAAFERRAEALSWLRRHHDSAPPSPAYLLARGELAEEAGELGAAAADFTRCLGLEAHTADAQLASVRPAMGLMRLALARGELGEATRHLERALAANPRDREALTAAAHLAEARGALEDWQRGLQRTCPSTELDLAVAETHFRRGRFQRAEAVLSAHREESADAGRLHLLSLLALGRTAEARREAEAAQARDARAALVVLTCDLLEGRDSDVAVDLPPAEAEAFFRSCVDAVLRGTRPELRERLRGVLPALQDYFPAVVRWAQGLAPLPSTPGAGPVRPGVERPR